MQKCIRCDIVFHLKERTRCLYCDSLLMGVDEETTAKSSAATVEEDFDKKIHADRVSVDRIQEEGLTDEEQRLRKKDLIIEQMVRDRDHSGLGRMQYVMSSYFRSRTLGFVYNFYRREFNLGRKFKRFLIQPLDVGAFLRLPWVVINFIDSILIRMTHNGYCKKCDCKYVIKTRDAEHDQDECEYNREFASLLVDIFTGKITHEEIAIQQDAFKKRIKGKRSAYYDLCSTKSKFSNVLDIVSIWISIILLLHVVINVIFPILAKQFFGFDFNLNLR